MVLKLALVQLILAIDLLLALFSFDLPSYLNTHLSRGWDGKGKGETWTRHRGGGVPLGLPFPKTLL